ncbi:MAG: hypothetical protein DSZ26_01760 [Thermovibrio sp.]|nr:MAG: hypothetical protein DSZ26_01760 [Thermovibrio sp.]
MKLELTLEEIEKLTRKELYEIAKELKIKGRSKMRKKELLERIKGELLLIEKASINEPITSNVEFVEPIEEKREEVELPTYSEEFVSLIPVNPELSFAVWNAFGERGVLKLYSKERLVFETEVNPEWKSYYVRYRAPFEEIYVELEVVREGKKIKLRSNKIVTPSDVVTLEAEEEVVEEIIGALKAEEKTSIPFGYRGKNG